MTLSVCVNGSKPEVDAPVDVTTDNGYEEPAHSHGNGATLAKPLPKTVRILRNMATVGLGDRVRLHNQPVSAEISG